MYKLSFRDNLLLFSTNSFVGIGLGCSYLFYLDFKDGYGNSLSKNGQGYEGQVH